MKTYTREELNKILELHAKWLRREADGVRADLSGVDLSRADLSGADLSRANLSRANLSRADLYGANLSKANLSEADLYGANLYEADLSRADLSGVDLSEANLSKANLSEANLSEADLYGANLSHTCIVGLYIGKHFAFYQPETSYLKIGCHGMSLSEWAERYKEIGEQAGYKPEEIELYGFTIKEYLPRIGKP